MQVFFLNSRCYIDETQLALHLKKIYFKQEFSLGEKKKEKEK